MESGKQTSKLDREEQIERSKANWSQLSESALNLEEEGAAEVDNMEMFKTLELHPTWGSFF